MHRNYELLQDFGENVINITYRMEKLVIEQNKNKSEMAVIKLTFETMSKLIGYHCNTQYSLSISTSYLHSKRP